MACGICGGQMYEIRSRYPHQPKREVCPTCLAERMDLIQEMSHRDYGRACSTVESPKLEMISK